MKQQIKPSRVRWAKSGVPFYIDDKNMKHSLYQLKCDCGNTVYVDIDVENQMLRYVECGEK